MPIPLSQNPSGRTLIIILSVFIVLDILVAGLRLWSRKIQKKSLALNDWALIISVVFIIALYISEVIVVLYGGAGLHAEDVYQNYGSSALIIAGKGAFAADLFWNAAITLIKISILDLYIAIFRNQTFKKITYAVLGLCLICGVAFILEEFLICTPLPAYWDISTPGGHCGNEQIAYMVPGVINMALDILIFGLPMPMLWSLQMPVSKKVITSIIFSIGLLICILAGIRLKFVLEIDYNDFTYTIINFAIFGALEPLLAIISACLPVLRPALSRIRVLNPLFPASKQRSIYRRPGQTDADGWRTTLRESTSTPKTHVYGIPLSRLETEERSSDEQFLKPPKPTATGKRGQEEGIVVTSTWSVTT